MIDLRSPDARTRRKAIETEGRSIPDDDLFSLTRILDDRSRRPVAAWLREALDRDPGRAAGLLLGRRRFGPKVAAAIVVELRPEFERAYGRLERAALYRAMLLRSEMDAWTVWEMLEFLSLDLGGEGPDRSPAFEDALGEIAAGARQPLVRLETARRLLAITGSLPPGVWAEAEHGVTNRTPAVRAVAAWLLSQRSDPTARGLVRRTALRDGVEDVRLDALVAVVDSPDGESDWMKELVDTALRADPSVHVRATLLARLLDRRGGPISRPVTLHDGAASPGFARTPYGPGRYDPWLRQAIERLAKRDPDPVLRRGARELMVASGS